MDQEQGDGWSSVISQPGWNGEKRASNLSSMTHLKSQPTCKCTGPGTWLLIYAKNKWKSQTALNTDLFLWQFNEYKQGVLCLVLRQQSPWGTSRCIMVWRWRHLQLDSFLSSGLLSSPDKNSSEFWEALLPAPPLQLCWRCSEAFLWRHQSFEQLCVFQYFTDRYVQCLQLINNSFTNFPHPLV